VLGRGHWSMGMGSSFSATLWKTSPNFIGSAQENDSNQSRKGAHE
jgi:hypothetical protein